MPTWSIAMSRSSCRAWTSAIGASMSSGCWGLFMARRWCPGSLSRADAGFASRRSMAAQRDPVGDFRQPAGAGAEGQERGMRLAAQRRGALARGVEAERGHVRRLATRGVLAGGLAERRRRALDVEDVVDDLEREAGRR